MKIKLSDIKMQMKKSTFWIGLFIVLVVIVLLVMLVLSFSKAKQTAKYISNTEDKTSITAMDWDNLEMRNIYKEKLWLRSQLILANDDSISLGINLKDSIVQIQIKGLPLIKSKIEFIQPESFLSEIDASIYSKLFGQPISLVNGKANLDKRPIRKKRVVAGADAESITTDSITAKRFYWEFISDNNIRIVINGCETINDSIAKKPSLLADMLKFRLKSKSRDSNLPVFYPTLFLWMNDKDAKAIYRSLPERPKLSMLN